MGRPKPIVLEMKWNQKAVDILNEWMMPPMRLCTGGGPIDGQYVRDSSERIVVSIEQDVPLKGVSNAWLSIEKGRHVYRLLNGKYHYQGIEANS